MGNLLKIIIVGVIIPFIVFLPIEIPLVYLFGRDIGVFYIALFLHGCMEIITPLILIGNLSSIYEWLEEIKDKQITLKEKEVKLVELENRKLNKIIGIN